jgi:hypothetical protein
MHDRALAYNGGLTVGRAKLQLLPWMRMVGAESAKLSIKVHLFIEGIPHHAHQEFATISTFWRFRMP